jgi:hypothetical protein
MDATTTIQEDWIKVLDDHQCVCGECENESKFLTNSTEGLIEADVDQIMKDLEEAPTKVIYGVCPVCGMEYQYRLVDSVLYLEPSEEEK